MSETREKTRKKALDDLSNELDRLAKENRPLDLEQKKKKAQDDINEAAEQFTESETAQNDLGEKIEKRALDREREQIEKRQDAVGDRRRAKMEVERLRNQPEALTTPLEKAEQRLERLERIGERDAMRDIPGFDPERVREQENREMRIDPERYIRQHDGALIPAEERELREALREQKQRKEALDREMEHKRPEELDERDRRR